jgi:hypothetical protein
MSNAPFPDPGVIHGTVHKWTATGQPRGVRYTHAGDITDVTVNDFQEGCNALVTVSAPRTAVGPGKAAHCVVNGDGNMEIDPVLPRKEVILVTKSATKINVPGALYDAHFFHSHVTGEYGWKNFYTCWSMQRRSTVARHLAGYDVSGANDDTLVPVWWEAGNMVCTVEFANSTGTAEAAVGNVDFTADYAVPTFLGIVVKPKVRLFGDTRSITQVQVGPYPGSILFTVGTCYWLWRYKDGAFEATKQLSDMDGVCDCLEITDQHTAAKPWWTAALRTP